MEKANVLVATVPGMISSEDLEPLRAEAEVEYLERDHIAESELAELCQRRDVLMLNYDVVKKLSPEFYTNAHVQALRSISTDITGMDWSSPAAAKENGVLLQHIPHYSTESVAETVLFEVLLHARQRLASFVDIAKGREVQARMGMNLRGRKAGVVGYGHIGARVAELLTGIGMTVLIWNRSPKPGVSTTTLEALFASCDVICLCAATQLAGDKSNVGMIGSELLQRCRDAILVNLAGEHLVQTDALVQALKSGNIKGYTVERSPTTLATVLADIDDVHLPPKNAWYSQESLDDLRQTWVANTLAALRGEPTNLFTAS